jgi:hypothetical protein
MDNPIRNEPEIKEQKHEESFRSAEGAETQERTDMSMKDPDTMVSMVVLLFACLALAVLAHLFV